MIISRTILIQDINFPLMIEQMQEVALVEYIQLYNHETGLMEISVDDSWAVSDDTVLDTVIADHDKDEDVGYVIGDLIPEGLENLPINTINYKTQLLSGLHPQRSFNNGLLTEVKYFKDRDAGTGALSTLAIQVDISYVLKDDALYNSAKTVESRTTTRTWAKNNGQLDPKSSKVTDKYYPHITESRSEGGKRRGNIFNIISKDLVILLIYTTTGDQEAAEALGIQMADKYEKQFANFVKIAAAQPLIDAIEGDAEFVWLDTLVPTNPAVQFAVPGAIIGETIRAYIVRGFKGDI